ncbi:MAG: endolytic transglycosylase MltG [Pseudomonadota bacterium]|nr:endolytic transglycosylase MltG [Pseudomonadota bacterium]
MLKKPLFLAFVIALSGALMAVNFAYRPVDASSRTVLVDIPRGDGFLQIIDRLDQAGLVTNRPLFTALAIFKGAARQIRAGEYELSSSMSPVEIIAKLVKGEIKFYMVTIPEDLTVREIAALLAASKLVKESNFLDLARDRRFVASLGVVGDSLEGYLYPETYKLDRSMGSREIIQIMNRQFWKRFTPEMRKRAAEMGMSINEIVTMASLIGKETGFKDEKPLISAVFYNRLGMGMKLQSDPTAVYDLEDFDGKITRRHLLRDAPHNTYRIQGLPPGPIANPDIDSLKAALYPARTNYLYFVANNNGSHKFSSNLTAHQQAISRYHIPRKK